MVKDHDSKKEKKSKVCTGKNASICKLLLWVTNYHRYSAARFYSWENLQRAWRQSECHFFFCSEIDCILGYVSVTQGLFRFCSCFEFNALPISLNPRPLKSEAETTDDQKVEYTDRKGSKSQDVSFKPDSIGGLCLPGLGRKNGSILQGFGHHH